MDRTTSVAVESKGAVLPDTDDKDHASDAVFTKIQPTLNDDVKKIAAVTKTAPPNSGSEVGAAQDNRSGGKDGAAAPLTVSSSEIAVVLAKLIEERVSKAFKRHDDVVSKMHENLKELNLFVADRYNQDHDRRKIRGHRY